MPRNSDSGPLFSSLCPFVQFPVPADERFRGKGPFIKDVRKNCGIFYPSSLVCILARSIVLNPRSLLPFYVCYLGQLPPPPFGADIHYEWSRRRDGRMPESIQSPASDGRTTDAASDRGEEGRTQCDSMSEGKEGGGEGRKSRRRGITT